MKFIFLFVLLAYYTTCCLGQKRPIDTSVLGKWPSVGAAMISNDGKYAMYTIENQPIGNHTLVIQATDGKWKMEIIGASDVFSSAITSDSKRAIFIKSTDSLGIATLGTASIEYIPRVSSFKIPDKGTGERLACQLNTSKKELVVQDFSTGRRRFYTAVTGYFFSGDGKGILLQRNVGPESINRQILEWVDLTDDKKHLVWQGANAENFVFDNNNSRLAFIAENDASNRFGGESIKGKYIRYYQIGTSSATPLIRDDPEELGENMQLGTIAHFSKDGNILFFNLK